VINVKPLIISALDGNAELISLLGGPRIYFMVAPNADEFPRITYFELNNVDEDYSDDAPVSSRVSVQISIWTKDPAQISPIVQEVDETMKGIGFYRTSSIDMYEDDVKVFHKALKYSGKFMI
jgi:Protein of unknown function (DUF3168)